MKTFKIKPKQPAFLSTNTEDWFRVVILDDRGIEELFIGSIKKDFTSSNYSVVIHTGNKTLYGSFPTVEASKKFFSTEWEKYIVSKYITPTLSKYFSIT